MLPTRWKIFRFISYLHIASVGIVAIFLGFLYIKYAGGDFEDRIGLTIFILLTSLLLCNGLLGLHLVEKCYPDKQPGKRFRVGSTIVIILTILFDLILFATCLYRIDVGVHDTEGMFWFGILFFIACSGIYICWQQIVLEKIIYRNHQFLLNSFLEEAP